MFFAPNYERYFNSQWVGWLSRYSDSLQAGRTGDRIPVRAKFSATFHTRLGAHPAYFTTGTGSFQWGVGGGVNCPPNLAPKLKKE